MPKGLKYCMNNYKKTKISKLYNCKVSLENYQIKLSEMFFKYKKEKIFKFKNYIKRTGIKRNQWKQKKV